MNKNKQRSHVGIGAMLAGLVALTICSAAVYNSYFAITFQNTETDPYPTRGSTVDKTFVSGEETFTEKITNFEAVKPVLKKYIADTVMPRKVHTFALEDVEPFYTKDGTKIEIAKLVAKYGNGVYYMPPQVVFLINNKLYVAAWGGESFAYPPMNGLSYKHFENLTYSAKGLIALDQLGLNYLYEDPQGLRDVAVTSAQAETGIYGIAVYFDKDQKISHVNVVKEKEWEVTTPGATILGRVPVLEFPENKSSVDPATESAQMRSRPGFASGKTGVHSRYGFKLWYPTTVNGDAVEYQGSEFDGSEHHYMIAGGDPSQVYIEANSAKMYCSSRGDARVGEKKGEPFVIATSSRSKLVDWGFQSYGFSDEFSFATQNAVCSMSVSGAMRLNMFLIEL